MAAFLYVIASTEDGPVKIGVASDVEQRVAQMQTGNPDELTAYRVYPVPGAYKAESEVHAALADRRRRGEWFNVNVAEAQAAIEPILQALRLRARRLPSTAEAQPALEEYRRRLVRGDSDGWVSQMRREVLAEFGQVGLLALDLLGAGMTQPVETARLQQARQSVLAHLAVVIEVSDA